VAVRPSRERSVRRDVIDAVPRTSACPDPENLERFLLGHLAGGAAVRLGKHLVRCDACCRLARIIKTPDGLVEELRRAREPAPEPEGPVGELIERLARLRPLLLEWPSEPPGASPGTGPTGNGAPDECDFLAPPQEPDELGRLGPYRILELLGVGGMGFIFEAENLKLKRHIALKVMKPALAASAGARQRFLREARAAAAIQHDHVVPIYQADEDRGLPFLVMPLLRGESLEQRLRREGRLPLGEVLRIGREAAAGLAAAHKLGLIHRDIKPDNIWLETLSGPTGEAPRSRVKILDFGLVWTVHGETQLTGSGAIVGTPAYMAPEQVSGGPVDHRSDLFSLGCVLYRLATGEPPFQGASTLAVLRARELKSPKPPREVDPGIQPALADLIMQLLARDPAGRPPSAWAVVEALAAIENEQKRGQESGAELPRRGGRWRPASLVLAGLSFLAGLLVGAALTWVRVGDGGKAETPAPAAAPVRAATSPSTGSGRKNPGPGALRRAAAEAGCRARQAREAACGDRKAARGP
jgi:hypothetical protein